MMEGPHPMREVITTELSSKIWYIDKYIQQWYIFALDKFVFSYDYFYIKLIWFIWINNVEVAWPSYLSWTGYRSSMLQLHDSNSMIQSLNSCSSILYEIFWRTTLNRYQSSKLNLIYILKHTLYLWCKCFKSDVQFWI